MKYFEWDETKNAKPKTDRGVGFEDIVFHIERGDLLDVLDHTKPERYAGQRIFVVRRDDHVYLVPFVEDSQSIFPDAASMCKHVAAVLYGVGARLDREPALLFTLRQVEEANLVGGAGARAAASLVAGRGGASGSRRIADEASLSDIFGIDLTAGPPRAEVPPDAPSPHRRVAARGRKNNTSAPEASARRPAKISSSKPFGPRTPAARRKLSERMRKTWAARRRALKKA